MIDYHDSVDGITADHPQGFFVGWPNPPSPGTHRELLMRPATGMMVRNYARQAGR